jgi:hypothetical protein
MTSPADRRYEFECLLRCYAPNLDGYEKGESVLLERTVEVEAYDETEARDDLERAASEMIDREGSRSLDWPLERLEVVRAKLVRTYA